MMNARREVATHLQAFSSLLAQDRDAKTLNNRDLQIIGTLVAHGMPLSVSAISSLLSVSAPQVSRITDRLSERGFLERVYDKADRRLVLYAPTPAGLALDGRVRGHFEAAKAVKPPVRAKSRA
jgi:DNA-binding MarR family transcriptional regulator